jgi:Flp pilus assembly protein TadG
MSYPKRRSTGDESGQALVEFALCAMIFFTLVFGVVEAARMFQSWVTVQHAAREAARYAVTGREDCDGLATGRENCILATAKKATSGLHGGGLSGADVSVSLESWSAPDYADPATASDAGGPCDAVQVKVTYRHQLVIPLFEPIAPDGLDLSGSQRMVVEPYGAC